MKTSNKILLGILLISFGFAITSHVVLRNKYLRQDFVPKDKVANFFFDVYELNQPKFIKLYKLDACNIKPGARPVLSIEKGPIKNIRYTLKNDTLVIHGDSSASQWAATKVILELPFMPIIDAKDCKVIIEGSRDTLNRRDFQLSMNNGHMYTRHPYYDTILERHFGTLRVTATNNSEIVLYRKDDFNNLDLDINSSVFQERNAKYKNISIRSDSSSTIITSGKNFLLRNK